jgi:hypothetical protein
MFLLLFVRLKKIQLENSTNLSTWYKLWGEKIIFFLSQ